MLKTCLYDKGAVDLKKLLRSGSSDEDIKNAIKKAVMHRAEDGFESQKRSEYTYGMSMARIGG
jgi:cyclic pyranopterin phosphate synthase